MSILGSACGVWCGVVGCGRGLGTGWVCLRYANLNIILFCGILLVLVTAVGFGQGFGACSTMINWKC